MSFLNKIKFWKDNARAISLPQSMLPGILAIGLSVHNDGFCWWTAVLAVIGVAFAHLGMNLADDYFDYKHENIALRSSLKAEGSIRARQEKCHYLTSGAATEKQLAMAIICFLAIAGLLGLIICIFKTWNVAWVALAGLFLGISYSGWPLHLCYHGFGELVIGIMFGPLNMIGVQLASCGYVSMNLVILSIAVGLLVTNILFVHSVMETEADGKMEKMTFARLLGKVPVMIGFCAFFAFTPFVIVIAGVIAGLWHPSYLAVLLLVPSSCHLLISLSRFKKGIPTDDTPKWWMGPMGDWESYKAAGMDWFLIRWLEARNIVTFFCLIIFVLSLIFS